MAVPSRVVAPPHPRNYGGEYFSTLWTKTDARLTRACEECWIGDSRSIAFQGTIDGVVDVFVVDERGELRRLTQSLGLAGPRHWLQSDGHRIACLMKDERDIVQLWTVSLEGELRQLTRCEQGIGSAFTWQGRKFAAVADGCVASIDADSGAVVALSPPSRDDDEIRPEACVFSPDGSEIAYVRRRSGSNHICVISAG